MRSFAELRISARGSTPRNRLDFDSACRSQATGRSPLSMTERLRALALPSWNSSFRL